MLMFFSSFSLIYSLFQNIRYNWRSTQIGNRRSICGQLYDHSALEPYQGPSNQDWAYNWTPDNVWYGFGGKFNADGRLCKTLCWKLPEKSFPENCWSSQAPEGAIFFVEHMVFQLHNMNQLVPHNTGTLANIAFSTPQFSFPSLALHKYQSSFQRTTSDY